MRPILLKGHERSITVVKYNYDGDLLFTASKDHTPCMWLSSNGDRIGTFNGHKGTVWNLDIDRFSTRLLTASADATAKLWCCQSGVCLATYPHRGPVRGVSWSMGGRSFATISDPFVDYNAQISIFDVPIFVEDIHADETCDNIIRMEDLHPRLEIDLPKSDDGKRVNPTYVEWLYINEAILVAFDNGSIRLFDPHNGDAVDELFPHETKIHKMRFNRNKTLFLTSSADHTAKLYDAIDFKHMKTYKTDRPVNDAVLSEKYNHILLGGGQEAMSVTTTSGKVGKFETRFFHAIYEEEFGKVKGHFGPINALDVHPNGRSYASGAEDGYVRLHFFDNSYLEKKDPVPEELQLGEDGYIEDMIVEKKTEIKSE